MKYTILALITALAACQSANEADYIVFADGSKYLKTEFEKGMKEGCNTQAVESVAHFDRTKYCDCMMEHVMANSSKIKVKAEAETAEEVSLNLLSYFESQEGSAEVVKCRDAAIDESKFDLTAEEKRFRSSFPPADTTNAGLQKHQAYLDCLWSKVKVDVGVREMIDPAFAESEKLKGFVNECAAAVGVAVQG